MAKSRPKARVLNYFKLNEKRGRRVSLKLKNWGQEQRKRCQCNYTGNRLLGAAEVWRKRV